MILHKGQKQNFFYIVWDMLLSKKSFKQTENIGWAVPFFDVGINLYACFDPYDGETLKHIQVTEAM